MARLHDAKRQFVYLLPAMTAWHRSRVGDRRIIGLFDAWKAVKEAGRKERRDWELDQKGPALGIEERTAFLYLRKYPK